MKKRLLSGLLIVSMVAAVLTGCNGKDSNADTSATKTSDDSKTDDYMNYAKLVYQWNKAGYLPGNPEKTIPKFNKVLKENGLVRLMDEINVQ